MPWRTATMVSERARFVLEAEQSFLSFSELRRRHNISRPTGHKWLDRYREEGLEGLQDRSHRPHSCPHATPDAVVKRILAIRRRRKWGAPKIQRLLRNEVEVVPSIDAIHRVLHSHGLVRSRKPRRRRTHPGKPSDHMDQPNATWTTDFKGEFRTGDGRLCYPLTVQDAHSRFLLACKGLPTLEIQPVRRQLERHVRAGGAVGGSRQLQVAQRICCKRNGGAPPLEFLPHLSAIRVSQATMAEFRRSAYY